MYSQIPVPKKSIRDDDMKGCIAFLPLVGVVIYAAQYYVNRTCVKYDVPICARAALFIIIPLVITGGFHIDGFMDTCDAKRSYGSKEKRLEILSDPHIGAFSVICLLMLTLAAFAGICIVIDRGGDAAFECAALVFVSSRGMAALTSLFMKKAKNNGMLCCETAINNTVIYCVLFLQTAASFAAILYISPPFAALYVFVFAVFTVYYRRMTSSCFGGVTGDTAGFYVAGSETAAIVAFALATFFA